MFSKIAVTALLSAAVASALPGQSPWSGASNHTGGWGGGAVESECVTSYATQYYTVSTVVPVVQSRTTWVPSNIVTQQAKVYTTEVMKAEVVTSYEEECITTSYPVTTVVYVTTVSTQKVPVYETKSWPEPSVFTQAVPVTLTTAVPSVEVCTEYETSCATSSTVIASTTCTPCATADSHGWKN